MFAADKFRARIVHDQQDNTAAVDITVSTQSERFCMTCNSTFTREFTQCPNDSTDLVELKNNSIIGSVIGSYRILSMVDEGGMGVVYKAEHLVMQRIVALKMIRSGAADQDVLMRFQQEAKAVSSLNHPNIVSIYGCEVSEEGIPFLVMEYIDGKNLTSNEIKSNLSLDLAVEVFIALCSALSHAHEKGVVHRDLKPGNIMFCQPASGISPDRVKILDFGIAKLLPASGKASMDLTQTGQPIGSPMYMSPEQCTAKQLDARSDIYSLGCVMYFTLTGRPPFNGKSIFELFNKHLSEKPAPLRAATLMTVPIELEEIVLKTLEKRPDRRYQSMKELEAALRAFKEKRSSPIPYLMAHLKRRLGSIYILPVVVCSGLAIICAFGLLLSSTDLAARRNLQQFIPHQPVREKYIDAYKSSKVQLKAGNYSAALDHLEHSLQEAKSIGQLSPEVYESLQAVQEVKLRQGASADAGRVGAQLEQFRWNDYWPDADSTQLHEEEVLQLEKQIRKNPTDSSALLNLAMLYNYQAHRLVKTGQAQKAQSLAEKALTVESSAKSGPEKDRATAISKEIIGQTLTQLGHAAEGEQILVDALPQAEKLFGEANPLVVALTVDLATSATQQNKFVEAKTWIERAETATRLLEGTNSHLFSICLENEGRLEGVRGNYDLSMEKLIAALSIRENLYGRHAQECKAIYDLLNWVAGRVQDQRQANYWASEAKQVGLQP